MSNPMPNFIPFITHPLGKHWDQPDPERILLDDKHALMDERTFNALPEYSSTIPTGVYEGKMWKRHDGVLDPRCRPEQHKWMLGWFGPSTVPDNCSINFREILIV